eukprot:scaffold20069_cov32-Tisochrysis_lutea.AAC.1
MHMSLHMSPTPIARSRQALETLLFFFGRGVAMRAEKQLSSVESKSECIIAECTGVWKRRRAMRDDILRNAG